MLFGSRAKTTLPTRDEALPGRDHRTFLVPSTHTVLGTPLEGPWPDGTEVLYVAMGCFWGVELVKNRETKEMLVPFNAAGEAALPVARVGKAALDRGLYLMSHWNVVMVVPPLTITRDEAEEGLAILDDALSIADEYVIS